MTIPRFYLLTALVAAALLAGCSTFDRRAQERSVVFNTLDEATRERLKEREIRVGDNFDMVYIALGAPDEKRETVTADGANTTWIFNAYWQEYRGERFVGYRRYAVYNELTKTYHVYYQPVHRSIYEERVEERLRVFFADGQVTAIEQARS